MKVQELMSKPAITCRDEDSLNTAASLMWDGDCGALPVVNDQDEVVAMITDRDICMAAYSRGEALGQIRVDEITNGTVFSVIASNSIQQAEKIMRDQQVRRLPVVDDERHVVGILSLNDIAREGLRERGRKKKDIGGDEVLKTLAGIGKSSALRAVEL